MLRKIISGSILIWIFFLCPYKSAAVDYYWIGGSGSWSDINHWATTSGGIINHLQVPTPLDDVFFDANSFTAANQVVTINVVNSVCRDMNWTGTGFTPTFTGSYDFRIYGSLTIVPNMNWNYNGPIFFESISPGMIITSAGKTFLNDVYFQGIGGGWSLADSLRTTEALFLNYGSLKTNNQNVYCHTFISENANIRTLILGNSIVTCNNVVVIGEVYGETFRLNSDNLTFDAGTSTLKLFGLGSGQSSPSIIISGSTPLVFYKLNSIDKCKIIFTKIFIQRLFWRFKTEGFSGSVV